MRFGQGRRGAEGKGRRSGDTWTSSKDQRPKSLTSWVGASTSTISAAGEIEECKKKQSEKGPVIFFFLRKKGHGRRRRK